MTNNAYYSPILLTGGGCQHPGIITHDADSNLVAIMAATEKPIERVLLDSEDIVAIVGQGAYLFSAEDIAIARALLDAAEARIVYLARKV